MNGDLKIEEKVKIILDDFLPMLKADLRRLADYTCPTHGKPGNGLNFSTVLLCMVACEVVGRISSENSSNYKATIEFIYRMAEACGDERYKKTATALIAFFRNGIAHSFVPKQLSNRKSGVLWAISPNSRSGICVDELEKPSGADTLSELRQNHLLLDDKGIFVIIPQVLCVDVLMRIKSFEQELQNADDDYFKKFEKGFDIWWKGISNLKGKLDDDAKKYLHI